MGPRRSGNEPPVEDYNLVNVLNPVHIRLLVHNSQQHTHAEGAKARECWETGGGRSASKIDAQPTAGGPRTLWVASFERTAFSKVWTRRACCLPTALARRAGSTFLSPSRQRGRNLCYFAVGENGFYVSGSLLLLFVDATHSL